MRIDSSNTPTLILCCGVTKLTSTRSLDRAEFAADDAPDMESLLLALRRLPDVRAEIVAEVTERLATGEPLTRAAALETAAASYNSPDGCG